MIQCDRTSQLKFATWLIITGLLVVTEVNCALAQIESDRTLGSENSVVIPLDPDLPVDVIEGGARRGINLFHSFREFNVGEGRFAYFENPNGVQNILSRVTGTNPSKIMGTLGVLGNANLFLINPNGIIFGQNARLDVQGSFVATTANEIRLGETGRFSATEPQTSNLLTVNPSALFFNAVAAQPIINQSQVLSLSGETNSVGTLVGLQVPVGKTLALVGGDVLLQFGNLTASEGRIELGSVAGAGEVSLNQSDDSWRLGYEKVNDFGDISIEGATVDVSGAGGGSLQIQGAQLEIKESGIFADTLGSKNGGEVLMRTTKKIVANNESYISTDILGSTIRAGGNLTLETKQLTVRGGATVSSSVFGRGTAGNLTVKARESVEVIGWSVNGLKPSRLATDVVPKAIGNTGELNIETERLTVRGGAAVSSSLFGQGKSGDLTVKASESVEVIGESTNGKSISGLFTQVEQGAVGNTGNLSIDTERLTVQGGAAVSSRIFGQGKSGDLTVKARESVEVIGRSVNGLGSSGLITNIQPGAIGDAGTLSVNTKKLTVRDGAQISSGLFGQGTAGNLTVKASESVKLIGSSADGQIPSGLFTSVESEAIGNAGDLIIETGRLIIRDGANVLSTTSGEGLAGNLMIKASESVEVIGESVNAQRSSLLSTSAESGAISNSGDLSIETGRLIIRDGALVQSATFDRGSAGNLTVKATDSVQVIGTSADGFASSLTATTTASGKAGDLTLKTRQLTIEDGGTLSSRSAATGSAGKIDIETLLLSVTNNAGIFVDSQGTKPGGNIEIQADSALFDDGIISAETSSTDGGNIDLQVQDLLLLRNGSQISTTAGIERAGGNGGNIDINSQFIIAVPQENSDISANAFEGDGGEVNITSQGIFGIEFREEPTPLSDITASSEFGVAGNVEIDAPDTDPSRRIVNLPTLTVEPEVVQACNPSDTQAQSEFIITGRGGLPPSAQESMDTDAIGIDWVTLNPQQSTESESRETSVAPETQEDDRFPDEERIIEAQGLVVGSDGKVILTAQAPTVTPHIPWLPNDSCKGS